MNNANNKDFIKVFKASSVFTALENFNIGGLNESFTYSLR